MRTPHDARLVDRLYRRLGPRYIWVFFGWAAVACYLGLAIDMVVMTAYATGSVDRAPELIAVAAASVTVPAAFMIARAWQALAPWRDWEAGHGSAEAAWRTLLTHNTREIPRLYAVTTITGFVITAYAADLLDLGLLGAAAFFVGGDLGVAATLAYLLFSSEAILQPAVREAAQAAGRAARTETPLWGIRKRLFGSVLVTTAFLTLVTGALMGAGDGGDDRLALGVAIALGAAAVIGLVFVRVFTKVTVEPIHALGAGTDRVAAGDLDTPVPVLSIDELGVLAGRFNEMLDGLRERAHLQAENTELDAALADSVEDVRRQAEQLRASRARIVAASDAGRRAVERDLHDGAQQHLVIAQLKLGLASRAASSEPEVARTLEEARQELMRGLEALRDLAHGIYPPVLESDGLPAALQDAIDRLPMDGSVVHEGVGRYAPGVESAVFFICREALQNAVKHAGPEATLTVHLQEVDGRLRFRVVDDGRGFDAAAGSGGGLQNMQDRAGALGGTLRITSTTGEGTVVIGDVPAQPVPVPAHELRAGTVGW